MELNQYERVVIAHYSQDAVCEEIARFSNKRWVAIHCQTIDKSGRPYLLRYKRKGKSRIPLKIESSEDVKKLLERFRKVYPRAFYASANVYGKLESQEDIKTFENIVYCLPTWDIDNELEKWEATIEAAKEIVSFLQRYGIEKSVFLKWSGNGMHVHVHHQSISKELLNRIHPLDLAYSMVEYVNTKLQARFFEIAQKHNATKLRVENKMDIQRVFTCPLSLHRSLNTVAVCIPPDKLDEFTPEWVSLEKYVHWKGWNGYVEGEANEMAVIAYKTIGGYPYTRFPKPTKKSKRLDEMILKWLSKE